MSDDPNEYECALGFLWADNIDEHRKTGNGIMMPLTIEDYDLVRKALLIAARADKAPEWLPYTEAKIKLRGICWLYNPHWKEPHLGEIPMGIYGEDHYVTHCAEANIAIPAPPQTEKGAA